MAIESIASVKSHFETGDRPTQQEFTDLIDTLGRVTLLAIASAAEGGKTGFYEILGDGDVTARSTGAVGRQILSVAGTASARAALGIVSAASEALIQGTIGSALSSWGANSITTVLVEAGTTASAQSAIGITTVGQGVTLAAATASAVASLGISNHVVQQVRTQTGAVATGTTQMPRDDTIPQITEGDEYMTVAITPKATDNRLLVEVVVNVAHSAVSTMTAALFRDSTADALAAASQRSGETDQTVQINFSHLVTAASISATTFRVRAGGNVAGQTTFNGVKGGVIHGGVMASSITITERIP